MKGLLYRCGLWYLYREIVWLKVRAREQEIMSNCAQVLLLSVGFT